MFTSSCQPEIVWQQIPFHLNPAAYDLVKYVSLQVLRTNCPGDAHGGCQVTHCSVPKQTVAAAAAGAGRS